MSTNMLRQRVEDALDWAPNLDASQVGVAAQDGVVTLTGHVPSFAEKTTAERVAKRVVGVKALANDLEVAIPGDRKRTDTEIAEATTNALEWDIHVPDDRITVTVRNGYITLEGSVEWKYQRESARDAVRNLTGVRGVDNLVTIKSPLEPKEVKAKIEAALLRDARLEAEKIRVETDGRTVVLRGTVDSWSDREEVEDAAWAAPGVWDVEDHITVTY